jgi:hypothetical protein
VNQKGLTYFLILVFLISAGTVFSKSVLDTRSASKAGSILQKADGKISPDFSIDEQTDPQGKVRIITEYQFTPTEIISNYSLKNYLLSKRHFADRESTRRTNLWFTSRFRN